MNARLLRHPVVIVGLIGLGLFGIYRLRQWLRPDPITLDASDPEMTPEKLGDRLLAREAVRMKLHETDPRIREELISILRTRFTKLPGDIRPTEERMHQVYDEYRDKFRTPDKRTFKQCYFNSQARPNAQQDAIDRLAAAKAGGPPINPEECDEHVDGNDFTELAKYDVEEIYEPRTAHAIFQAKVGEWFGPFAGQDGWHLFFVVSHHYPKDIPFNEARREIILEWQRLETVGKLTTFLKQERGKYEVEVDESVKPKPVVPEPPTAKSPVIDPPEEKEPVSVEPRRKKKASDESESEPEGDN